VLPTHGIGLSRESTRCWLMIAVTNSAEGIILVVFGTPIAFAVPPGYLTRAPRRLRHRLLTHQSPFSKLAL
jgi:hypothetical protein